MASGKSTIGRALAEQIGWPFVDLDAEIEAQTGKRIDAIFSEVGEANFRRIETSVLQSHVLRIESEPPRVIALGGGAFIQDRNWQLISESKGITLWLDCSLETILRRLGDDNIRPLAANRKGLDELFQDRRPLYERANYRVDIDTDDVREIVSRILLLPPLSSGRCDPDTR